MMGQDLRVPLDELLDLWPTGTDIFTDVHRLRDTDHDWYMAARRPHVLDLSPVEEEPALPDNIADVDAKDIEEAQNQIDDMSKELRSIMLAQCVNAVASDKATAELEAMLSDLGLDDAKVDNVCVPFSSYLMDADLLAAMLRGAKHIPQGCKDSLLSYYMEKAMDACLDSMGKQRRQEAAKRLLSQYNNLVSKNTAYAAVRTLSGNQTQAKAGGRT